MSDSQKRQDEVPPQRRQSTVHCTGESCQLSQLSQDLADTVKVLGKRVDKSYHGGMFNPEVKQELEMARQALRRYHENKRID